MEHKKEANKELGKMLLDVCKYFITIGIAGQFVTNYSGKEISFITIVILLTVGCITGAAGYFIIRKTVDKQ